MSEYSSYTKINKLLEQASHKTSLNCLQPFLLRMHTYYTNHQNGQVLNVNDLSVISECIKIIEQFIEECNLKDNEHVITLYKKYTPMIILFKSKFEGLLLPHCYLYNDKLLGTIVYYRDYAEYLSRLSRLNKNLKIFSYKAYHAAILLSHHLLCKLKNDFDLTMYFRVYELFCIAYEQIKEYNLISDNYVIEHVIEHDNLPFLSNYTEFIHTEISRGIFWKIESLRKIDPIAKFICKTYTTNNVKSSILTLYHSEIFTLRQLNHPNILKLNEVNYFYDEIKLYMEHYDGVSLFSYLSNLNNSLTLEQIKSFLRTILQTIHYIHSKNIILNTMNLENIILLTEEFPKNIKLIDVGACAYTFPLKFKSPESVSKQTLTNKVDSWSLGVIIYYIFYRKFPFTGRNDENITEKILNREPSYIKESKVSRIAVGAKNFIQLFLNKNPEDRISIDEALTHSFLN